MNPKQYKIITIIGLLAIVSLQVVWIYNSYTLNRLQQESELTSAFDEAVFQEAYERFQTAPKGSEINTGAESNAQEDIAYIEENLFKLLKRDVSLSRLNDILCAKLEGKGYSSKPTIEYIDTKSDVVLDKVNNGVGFVIFKLKPSPIYTRTDKSKAISFYIANPTVKIYERMGIVVCTSAALVFIVVVCIIRQIKIITKQRRIAKIKSDLSYAMIHDMKSPISLILIGLEKTEGDIGEDERRHYRKLMKEETTHLLTLTKKLLTIAKAEEGRLDIEKTVVELPPMVEAIADKYKMKAKKPITIDIDLKELVVLADEEYIGEVIGNLMDNAVKYSKEDKIYIKVSSGFDDKYSYIRVYDEGIGIAESDQKKIFDKFERAAAGINHTRRGGAAGFGLGLSYVAKVVEAHGGYISLQSKEGKYSEFSIYLPNG